MTFSAIDHAHMARALRLAELGLYTTQPNPRVGCVIAHGAQMIGEGWHQRAGGAHAEVVALRAAGDRARGATAYVTLEPCGKFGRTPPCADALIAAGVMRVVIASEDRSQADGGAVARMRAAGIVVESGLLRDAARELNRGFFSRVERGRPWLRVKLAMSLDGRTALSNGESKWITGAAAREDVQRWRARSSAILTGSGTVLSDNPRLSVRLPSLIDALDGRPLAPLRVIIDRQLRTPRGSHVLDGSVPSVFFHDAKVTPSADIFRSVDCIGVEAQNNRLDLSNVLATLAQRGMNEVQVEAGPTLCGALLKSGFVDELLLYIAPLVLGDHARSLFVLPDLERMTDAKRLRIVEQRQVGDDLRILYRE